MGSEVREAALIPLLRGDRGRGVTFVVDSSESARTVLGSVKRLLIQTLLRKAAFRDSLFNIVTFSGHVRCWSHHMLPCAPDTVYLALSWIHSISCSPGSDLWGALNTALADRACRAVHLLCSGAHHRPEALLAALPPLAAGRPVNVFYLQSSGGWPDADYLQRLCRATGGSCYMIPVGLNGVLEEVIPLCVVENRPSPQMHPSLRCRCPSTSVLMQHAVPSALSRCSLGNPPLASSVAVPEFFPGCRVLARRKMDGLYYAGTVTQEVQGCRGLWVVEFDPPGDAACRAVSSHRELVCSLDMVSHTGAHRLHLLPGDAVLSPWEPDLRRYGPGRVTVVSAGCRDGCGVGGASSLRVQMWNSCVHLVPASVVEPIQRAHYNRIVRELQITAPPAGRCCRWPWAPHCRCERTAGFQEAEEDRDVRKSDPEVASDSSSSSSRSERETSRRFPPAVKLRGVEQRPPWRYWRRTGPEPQHRQPGSVNARRTPPLARFHLPVPPISTSPNHSALFQPVPGATGKRANIKDVFRSANFRPHPPVGLQTSTGSNAAVYA